MPELISSLAFDQMARYLTDGLPVQHIDGLPTSTYYSDFHDDTDD